MVFLLVAGVQVDGGCSEKAFKKIQEATHSVRFADSFRSKTCICVIKLHRAFNDDTIQTDDEVGKF